MTRKTLLSAAALLLLSGSVATAQEENRSSRVSIDYSVDVVSRYVWRGLLQSSSPNIQPAVSLTAGGFSLGSWASTGTSQEFVEVDLFASYTAGGLTLAVYDYYNEVEPQLDSVDFFCWKKETTGHLVDGAVSWAGTENFPLSVSLSAILYGGDLDENSKQNYSTYLELGYPVRVGDYQLDLFAGGTLSKGLYHDKPGVVNVGFKTTREIAITDRFKLPVSATFAVNPAKQDVFFVVGVTL